MEFWWKVEPYILAKEKNPFLKSLKSTKKLLSLKISKILTVINSKIQIQKYSNGQKFKSLTVRFYINVMF